MPNRSTSGVLMISGGKCPPKPIGATNPGPRTVEASAAALLVPSALGLDSTSR